MPRLPPRMPARAAFSAIWVQSKSCRSSAVFSTTGSVWLVMPMKRVTFWSRSFSSTFSTPSGASMSARSCSSVRLCTWMRSRWSVCRRFRLPSMMRCASSPLRFLILVARKMPLRRVFITLPTRSSLIPLP